MLPPDRRRLVGAAEGFEGLGDGAGGVFCPGMVRAVGLGVDGERAGTLPIRRLGEDRDGGRLAQPDTGQNRLPEGGV